MRCLFALACCLSLSAGDVNQLRHLQEKNLIFQLREALQQPGWNDSEEIEEPQQIVIRQSDFKQKYDAVGEN